MGRAFKFTMRFLAQYPLPYEPIMERRERERIVALLRLQHPDRKVTGMAIMAAMLREDRLGA